MSNYPSGTSERDPHAPWNAPNTESAEVWAVRQVTGDNCDLTTETFAEFIAKAGEEREPVQSKEARPYLCGPISNVELLMTMFRSSDFAHCAAACFELRARFLADDYTRRVIDSEVDKGLALEVAA